MGDDERAPLRLQFNPKIRLEFRGATITSDAGLLAFRELDDALGLTPIASDYLQESRTGRNIQHHLVPLLRQSIYSCLAGYDDTNDAERLSQDLAMRVVVASPGSDHNAASTSEMGRFEMETLTQEDNLKGLAGMNSQWVAGAIAHTPHRRVILDRRVQCTVSRKDPPTTVTSSVSAIILSFCSTSSGIAKQRSYGQATSTVPMIGKKSSIRWWSVT